MQEKWKYFYLLFICGLLAACNPPDPVDFVGEKDIKKTIHEEIRYLKTQFLWDEAYTLQKELMDQSSSKSFEMFLSMLEILENKSDFEEGKEYLGNISDIFTNRQFSDPEKIKWVNINARFYRKLSENETADSLTVFALELNPLISNLDSILWVESLVDKSEYYYKRGDFKNQIATLSFCHRTMNRIGSQEVLKKWIILLKLAEIHNYIRQYPKAEKYLNKADSIFIKEIKNDYRKECQLNSSQAVAALFQGHLETAEFYINNIAELINQYPFQQPQIASYYYNSALLQAAKGNTRNAIATYEKAYRIYENADVKRFSNTINFIKHNLAVQHILAGYLDKAENLFQELKLYYEQKQKKDYILASTLLNLGRLRVEYPTFKYKNAEFYLLKSIKVYKEILGPQSRSLLLPLITICKEKRRQKEYDTAVEYLDKAFEIGKISLQKDEITWGMLFEQKALLSKDFENYSKALSEINKGLSYLGTSKIIIQQVNLLLSKSEILSGYLRSLNFSAEIEKEAFNHLKDLDTIFAKAKSKIVNQKDLFGHLKKMKSSYEIGIRIVSKRLLKLNSRKNSSLEIAWEFFEKSKAVALLDFIAKSQNINAVGLQKETRRIENSLYERIAYFESRLEMAEAENVKDSINTNILKDSLLENKHKYDSLITNIKKSQPAYHAIKFNEEVLSLSKFQSSLALSETLLEYFRTDTALYAFGVNREDATFQKLALPKDFDSQLETFLMSSKLAPKSDLDFKNYYAQTAHSFYQILVKPLLDSLQAVPHEGKSQLIVVPDGKLGYLPFDMLLTEESMDVYNYKSYPFLMKDFSIRSAYSATLMKVLENKKIEDKELMAAFAPDYINKETLLSGIKGSGTASCEAPKEEDFRELMQAGLELNKILEHLDGDRFDSLEASEEQFKAVADQYRILHLNMHGFTNDCDPMYSGLAFTPRTLLEQAGRGDTTNPTNEGILHAYEIYNMRINAELVVMSACQTGLGKIQAGEGIMSLARAFAHAGSPNTVMSLWQVDEAATRKLMTQFYKHLGEGKGKDEALQLAKLAYLENNAEAHPFYWAGFVLIGDDKPIVEDSWMLKYGWMVIISIFILISIFFVLRRNSMPAHS